jgi:pre-mRNA-splicing factor CWC26
MSSKLDYLKKYGGSTSADQDKKKRKKKPVSNSRMKVMDDEDEANKSSLKKSSDDNGRSFWDAGGKEEEAVVVEYTEDRHVSRGSWSAIEENDKNGGRTLDSEDESPPRRSRHDSDNDTDQSPPRKRGAVKANTRHGSDDESPLRKKTNSNTITRHHSDDESPPRKKANSNTTTRHDSDDESPPRERGASNGNSRHGSDEEPLRRKFPSHSESAGSSTAKNMDASPPRKVKITKDRHDSSDDEPPRRQVKDDSSSSRRRHDSDDKSTATQIGAKIQGKQEAESSSSKDRKDERRSKTASGHNAGLQTGEGFGKTEKELKSQRDEEMKGGDPYLQGAGQDTVYRDKKGKKLDMLNEFMRQQAVREGKEFKLEKAQHEWGKGLVQKQELEAMRAELAAVADEPFARTVENPRMEAMRKEKMRDGDPMAEYFARLKEKEDDVNKSKGIYI